MEIMTEMYLRLGLNDLANSSLGILKANFPDSNQLDENGNFIVSTQITDPSFLYSVTFGLLGSNKRDTPLAPTSRPRSTDTAFGFQEVAQPLIAEERSLLNILTLGMLGNSGDQETQEENNNNDDETTEN
jgi:outer membrane protein assembly factor BamD